ncbi:5'/3'-nucleotidase SurE [Tichowtungia aerotolerans]|uniref:5'-nucleotidase SurE n=1 Tax=Tichowtungia aerotolerans TaxID=2697043 RepID=A0A6P1MCG4_9BACT|nr:5'/3'-nucleotidase SurE [Tichowtungia aerotolerans]QHI70264.1 5'/3'-nucleotidase SurE [Tichowtungia aerotolerans]
MKILISNDDGIHAPGISALYHAVGELGDLTVVAPDVERSAAGHSITLSDPIKCIPVEKEDGVSGYAISGTPADCIKLAVRALMEDAPPDLVLSGINLGSNTGISVLYSGTVSAATEGVILGIPGVAFSLCTYRDPQWDMAKRVALEITRKLMKHPIPPGLLLNVNMPNLPYDELKGVKVTRMGRSRFIEKFHKRLDPQGRTYYWLDGDLEVQDSGDDIDIHAVRDGYVSITPIHFDLTAREHLDYFQCLEERA